MSRKFVKFELQGRPAAVSVEPLSGEVEMFLDFNVYTGEPVWDFGTSIEDDELEIKVVATAVAQLSD